MEFNEKFQQLRKEKGYTQEEIANKLYVSRTAISKWESGRGLPNIASLKSISELFGVTIDDLLSTDELVKAAEVDKKDSAIVLRTVLYGMLDILNILFLLLPLYGEQRGKVIVSVTLFSMKTLESYMIITYVFILSVTILFGIMELILQNSENVVWKNNSLYVSMILTVFAVALFTMSRQPYAGFFQLALLVMKGIIDIKQH